MATYNDNSKLQSCNILALNSLTHSINNTKYRIQKSNKTEYQQKPDAKQHLLSKCCCSHQFPNHVAYKNYNKSQQILLKFILKNKHAEKL